MIANVNINRSVEEAVQDVCMVTEYSDFLAVYLLQSPKGVKEITNLTLSLNNIPIKVTDIANLWCVRSGYVEIVNQKKNSVRVRLSNTAYLIAEIFVYVTPIVKRTYWRRFKNLIKVVFNVIFSIIKELFLDLRYVVFHKRTWQIIKGIGVILGIIVAILTIYMLSKQLGFLKSEGIGS